MQKRSTTQPSLPVTRRQLLGGVVSTWIVSPWAAPLSASTQPDPKALRAINVMNFIRAEEPREPMDLMLPVREQMQSIRANNLPATWLLQYDALTEGPFVGFLKEQMPASHEAGLWFEMNRRLCDDAGIPWRGRPDWEWDYHVPVAYSIGYPPDQRRKLVDTAMATFQRIFGHKAATVASWNLDAVTVAHLADHYGIDALGNCRDQLATDGFTIWGAPIAGYYPCRNNAWSPAVETRNQIGTPMFRLLGQDPVYYYDKTLPYPDTMEPVWPSGRSRIFIDRFLRMIDDSPTQDLAYAQLGQENSFGWPEMREAYPLQMQALAALRAQGKVHVETMAETGRRFKAAFRHTPPQAQIMLEDPFGQQDPGERTIWYQSCFYRANLHFRGDAFYLRDLHVYNDRFEQPYLNDVVEQHGIEQRLLAVLDGYHWSDPEPDPAASSIKAHTAAPGDASSEAPIKAMGRFSLITDNSDRQTGTETLSISGQPDVQQQGSTLRVRVPLQQGGALLADFTEPTIRFQLASPLRDRRLALDFEWSPTRTTFVDLRGNRLQYRFRGFSYSIAALSGSATATSRGVQLRAAPSSPLRLGMAQPPV